MTTLLFICTGNTCRSPMAECLFNALCRRDGRADIRAISAGVSAMAGMPASPGAQHAMAKRGLSLAAHLSQPVTQSLLDQADWVMGVSRRHIEALKAQFPGATIAARAFDPPIPDPYGGDDDLYEQTAQAMEPQIAAIYHLLVAQQQA